MSKKGIYYTIASAILFGITPLLTTWIYTYGANTITVVCYRSIFVTLVLAMLLRYQQISFRIPKATLLKLIIVSFGGSGFTTLLLFSSYTYIDTGTATSLHFLYPVFVTLMIRFTYHEHLEKSKLFALCIAMLGMCCFLYDNRGGSMLGFVLAIASSITYAFYMVYLEKSKLTQLHPYVVSFYIGICIMLETICYHLIQPSIQWMLPLPAYGGLLLLAICSSFLAVVWLQKGILYLGSTTASLFCLFEPITSLFIGILFLQESVSLIKFVGSGMILLALVQFVYVDKHKKENTIITS